MPAKKPGEPSRRAKQAAKRTRVPARPGQLPKVLDGYIARSNRWHTRSPAGLALAALNTGATWEIAAKVAHVHEDTVAAWNARGAEIAAALTETGADPAPDTPLETLAYLHFHRQAQHARVAPVHAAIGAIDQAVRAGNITAAEMMLKRHPAAHEYRPAETHELSGPAGGAIPVDVRAALRVSVEAMVERMAANRTPDALPPGDDG